MLPIPIAWLPQPELKRTVPTTEAVVIIGENLIENLIENHTQPPPQANERITVVVHTIIIEKLTLRSCHLSPRSLPVLPFRQLLAPPLQWLLRHQRPTELPPATPPVTVRTEPATPPPPEPTEHRLLDHLSAIQPDSRRDGSTMGRETIDIPSPNIRKMNAAHPCAEDCVT